MSTVTNVETATLLAEHNWCSVFPKFFNPDWALTEQNYKDNAFLPPVLGKPDNYALSCGTSQGDIATMFDVCDNIEQTFGQAPKIICVDIANGYLDKLISVCREIRDKMPEVILMAGNVVTPEGLVDLVENGHVDIIKTGIGSGAACTTRLKTGVGYPQLSAVIECSEAARELGAHVISDGGAVFAGDLCKAFAARSSFVMLGSMLSAHNESPGDLIIDSETGKKWKEYYGMSSRKA